MRRDAFEKDAWNMDGLAPDARILPEICNQKKLFNLARRE
jgi:hypothetical protein